MAHDLDADAAERLRALLARHAAATDSQRARDYVDGDLDELAAFVRLAVAVPQPAALAVAP